MRSVLFLILFVGLLACGKQTRDAEFNWLWAAIVRSPTSDAEYKAVNAMSQFMIENGGGLAIYTVDKAGTKRNIQNSDYRHKVGDIASFELHVHWHSGGKVVGSGLGSGWRPKQIQHAYNFFLE